LVHVQDRHITDTKDLENPRRIDNSLVLVFFYMVIQEEKARRRKKR
jgi:hypothetical protein